HPLARMPQVVADLLDRARRNFGQLLVTAAGQALEQQHVEALEQELARDDVPEMAVGLLDQQQVLELVAVPQEGEIVLAAAGALELGGVAVEQACLPDVVEREVRVRELFLELRCAGHVLGEPLPEDQRVVPEPQDVPEPGLVDAHDTSRYRFSTPSGMS